MPDHAPKRLAQKLVALPAMKLVKEIFEVTGRRLFEFFQAEQLSDFVAESFSSKWSMQL